MQSLEVTTASVRRWTPPWGELDPALLAFVKCHVTSPLKWEALRLMAEQEGAWVCADDIGRVVHRSMADVETAMSDLAREGVVEFEPGNGQEGAAYRLPPLEPTTVVLKRLRHAVLTDQRVRGILAANLVQVQRRKARPTAAS